MDRNRSPDNVAQKPPYSANGTPGFYTDENGGTTVRAQEMNQLIEEIRNVLVAAGVTPSPLSDDQLASIVAGAAAAKSAQDDTGSVHCLHTRVVLASGDATGARARGIDSAVIASDDCDCQGRESAVIACSSCNAASENGCSAVIASTGSLARAVASILVASRNARLVDQATIAGGYSTSAPPPGSDNQHLTWVIRSNGGHAHFAGTLKVGGNPNTGSAPLFQIDSDGNVFLAGNLAMLTGHLAADAVTANHDLLVGGDADVTGHVQAGKSLSVPTGTNQPAGVVAVGDVAPWPPQAGNPLLGVLYNTLLGANSHVYASVKSATGGVPVIGRVTVSAGSASIEVYNLHPTETAEDVQVRWWILNPA